MAFFANYRGSGEVVPPLNSAEVSYLRGFAESRRMYRVSGPYVTDFWYGACSDDIPDPNLAAEGQPDLECQWVPTPDGKKVEWNRSSQFPFAKQWLEYVVRQFLAPAATLSQELTAPVLGRYYAPEFREFTFDHVLDGVVDVVSETGEHWQIVVEKNCVTEIPVRKS